MVQVDDMWKLYDDIVHAKCFVSKEGVLGQGNLKGRCISFDSEFLQIFWILSLDQFSRQMGCASLLNKYHIPQCKWKLSSSIVVPWSLI